MKQELNVWFVHHHIYSVNLKQLVYVLQKLHLNKMENVYHAITLIFGIMIEKNVNLVLLLMFLTKIEENVSAQLINLLIPVLLVCNVCNQVIGIQIKEDAFNVQINKSMID